MTKYSHILCNWKIFVSEINNKLKSPLKKTPIIQSPQNKKQKQRGHQSLQMKENSFTSIKKLQIKQEISLRLEKNF